MINEDAVPGFCSGIALADGESYDVTMTLASEP